MQYSVHIPRCRHSKTNGTQCGSPALRGRRFCFCHKNWRGERIPLNAKPAPGAIINLPVLEDADSIEVAIMQVLRLILAGQIDPKMAGLLLYGLQTASLNLRHTQLEPKLKERIVGDDLWTEEDFEDEAEDEEAADGEEEQDGDESDDVEDEVSPDDATTTLLRNMGLWPPRKLTPDGSVPGSDRLSAEQARRQNSWPQGGPLHLRPARPLRVPLTPPARSGSAFESRGCPPIPA